MNITLPRRQTKLYLKLSIVIKQEITSNSPIFNKKLHNKQNFDTEAHQPIRVFCWNALTILIYESIGRLLFLLVRRFSNFFIIL